MNRTSSVVLLLLAVFSASCKENPASERGRDPGADFGASGVQADEERLDVPALPALPPLEDLRCDSLGDLPPPLRLVCELKSAATREVESEQWINPSEKIARRFASLGRSGRQAVPYLRKLIRKVRTVRDMEAALNALEHLGPHAVDTLPDLMVMLDTSSFAVIGDVVEVIGAIGPEAAAATPRLITRLRDRAAGCCHAELAALESIGDRPRESIPAIKAILVEELAQETPLHELSALGALRGYCDADDLVVDVVEVGLGAEKDTVRSMAVHALQWVEDLPIELLSKALQDESELVRESVFDTSELWPEVPRELLSAVVKTASDEALGFKPAMMLARYGRAARAHARSLLPLLRHKDANVRLEAVIALGRMGSTESSVTRAVAAATRDSDPAVSLAARVAKHRLKPGKSRDLEKHLKKALKHETDVVRAAAVDGLTDNWPASRSIFKRILQNDPSAFVVARLMQGLEHIARKESKTRRQAIGLIASVLERNGLDTASVGMRMAALAGLRRLGGLAQAAENPIRAALYDPDPAVRIQARIALCRIIGARKP